MKFRTFSNIAIGHICSKGNYMHINLPLLRHASLPRLLVFTFALTTLPPITANATLLGRLNVYYSGQTNLPKDEMQLQAMDADLTGKIHQLEVEIVKANNTWNAQQSSEALSRQKAELTAKQNKVKELLKQLSAIQSNYAAFNKATSDKQLLTDNVSADTAELSRMLNDPQNLDQTLKQLTTAASKDTDLANLLTADSRANLAGAKVLAKRIQDNKMALAQATQTVAEKTKTLADAYEARDKILREADSLLIADETVSGVKEGVGATTFITGIGSNSTPSVAINVYRFNLLFGKRETCVETPQDPSCTGTGEYNSMPIYIFLKKPLNSKVDSTTLSNDLLDNEYGGTVNFKLSGGWTNPFGIRRFFSFEKADDPEIRKYGAKWLVDLGVKLVEAPATGTTTTAENSNWISTGYFGLGFNLELPIFTSSNSGSDVRRNITPGSTPAGGMALGLGVYKNYVNSNQFDNTPFTAPIPKNYSTWAVMYEIKITELLSVKGTRIVPISENPLGSYTSLQMGYTF